LGPGTVRDFWRWALGDLRMNNARGDVVEYLVARAVRDQSPIRVEWGSYDARSLDGTLIEVKAAAYLQSWVTKRLSTPTWSFKSVRSDSVWSEEAGEWIKVDPATRVHVWVFALHTCRDPAAYDPLDVAQWEFRVMPHQQLLSAGQTSARLAFFDRLGIEPVPYPALADAIAHACEMIRSPVPSHGILSLLRTPRPDHPCFGGRARDLSADVPTPKCSVAWNSVLLTPRRANVHRRAAPVMPASARLRLA